MSEQKRPRRPAFNWGVWNDIDAVLRIAEADEYSAAQRGPTIRRVRAYLTKMREWMAGKAGAR